MENLRRKAIPALCLLVIAGILVAALWPFNPHPRNEVSWTPNGLWFGDYGSIRTLTDTVRPASLDGSCSLEIWLTPGETDDFNVILAYARPRNPLQFRIGQSGDAFYAIRIPNGSLTKGPYIDIPHVFREGKASFTHDYCRPARNAGLCGWQAGQNSRGLWSKRRRSCGQSGGCELPSR